MENIIKALNEKLSASLAPEAVKDVTDTIQEAINENVEKIKEKNKKFLFYTKRKLQEDAQKYGDYVSAEREKELNEKVEAKEKELNEKAEAYGKYVLAEMMKKSEEYAEYVKKELSGKAEKYAEYVQEESYKDAEKYIVESFVKYVDGIKEDIEKEIKSNMTVINEKKNKEATKLVEAIKSLIGYKESSVTKENPVNGKIDELIRRNHILESKLKDYESKTKLADKNTKEETFKKKVDEEISKLPLSKRAEARRMTAEVKDEIGLKEKMNAIKEGISRETVKPSQEAVKQPSPSVETLTKLNESKPAISSLERAKRLSGI